MTTRQLGLFDVPRPVVPADPNLIEVERRRLGPKCTAILELLRERPRNNMELAGITHRFGGRIYDLRLAGCAIRCDHDRTTGLAIYTLGHEPEGLG